MLKMKVFCFILCKRGAFLRDEKILTVAVVTEEIAWL